MADNIFNKSFDATDGGGSNKPPYVIGRVTKVVYGPVLSDGTTPDPDYEGPASLGCIRYVVENSAQYATFTGDSNKLAKPLFSFVHQYPTENELVMLIVGPSPIADTDQVGIPDMYYFPPYNLWKANNHNAQPSIPEYYSYISSKDTDYESSQQGVLQQTSDQSIKYPLGNNFPEIEDIRNLRVFIGDILFEGRFGQSIRFGTSLKANVGLNNWAESNNDGDPITIIRNGQGRQPSGFNFDLTVEDINVDQSSIYLTAGQPLFIEDLKNFPLTSWNLTIQSSPTTTVAQLAFPISTNDTISPQQQDNTMLS